MQECLEDKVEALSDRMEARFDSLKEWTLDTLHSQRVQLEAMAARLLELETRSNSNEDILTSFKRDLDEMQQRNSDNMLTNSSLNQASTSTPMQQRNSDNMLTNSSLNQASTSTPNPSPLNKRQKWMVVPHSIEDVSDKVIREAIRSFYKDEKPGGCKLTPAQLAFVHYYFHVVKKGEYSGKVLCLFIVNIICPL